MKITWEMKGTAAGNRAKDIHADGIKFLPGVFFLFITVLVDEPPRSKPPGI